MGTIFPVQARREFRLGVVAQLPILLGVAPFGMIFGALAVSAGLSPVETQGLSFFLFAGSAQLVAVRLMVEMAPVLVILATVLVINLRHILYSASIAPYINGLSTRWKIALSWLLTDEAYVVAIGHYTQSAGAFSHWFFLGTGLTLWAAWQLSTAGGILLGAAIPDSWPLDFALPLTFISLMLPSLKDRPSVAAALVSGLTALIFNPLPYKLGLLLATACGI
ncbi:MAG: AzlC family ABC transporter permease, partial [Anaerolineales bacterium]